MSAIALGNMTLLWLEYIDDDMSPPSSQPSFLMHNGRVAGKTRPSPIKSSCGDLGDNFAAGFGGVLQRGLDAGLESRSGAG